MFAYQFVTDGYESLTVDDFLIAWFIFQGYWVNSAILFLFGKVNKICYQKIIFKKSQKNHSIKKWSTIGIP